MDGPESRKFYLNNSTVVNLPIINPDQLFQKSVFVIELEIPDISEGVSILVAKVASTR